MIFNHPNSNKFALLNWLPEFDKKLYLFSPFVQKSGIDLFKENLRVSLLIRGLPDDFATGVTSIEALQSAIQMGWEIKYNPILHAKIFWASDGSAFFGSANLTGNGFNGPPKGNFEITASTQRLPATVLRMMETIWNKSKVLTEGDLAQLRIYVGKHRRVLGHESEFPLDLTTTTIPGFSLLDLPQSASLHELHKNYTNSKQASISVDPVITHDMNLLCLDHDSTLHDIHRQFNRLPLVRALLDELGDGKYFGHLRRWLREIVEDVPTPSQQDYNTQLNKLYDFIVEANQGLYEKKRPNHSEGLFRIK